MHYILRGNCNTALHPHDLRWSHVLRAWQGFS
nr:MAG TPA: hypothetical protein [Caudoviricetes sp.]